MSSGAQPRLDERGGGASDFGGEHCLPSSMAANTELGVYVKWALLLQEKLEQMQTHRTTLKEHVMKVQQENLMLRQALHKDNPSK